MVLANYDLELRDGWRFYYGEPKQKEKMDIWQFHASCKAGGALEAMKFDEEHWRRVSIPHDWMTELPITKQGDPGNGYKERGTGWYYLKFQLPEEKIEEAELIFDGVLGNSVVFVNGVVAARNFSGYNRFSCQVGDYLLSGEENEIAVYVDARRWEGWWYEGAGIYRPVRIAFRPSAHFDWKQCFVRSEQKENGWNVVATLGVLEAEGFLVSAVLKDGEGIVIAEKTVSISEVTDVCLPVANPVLWSPQQPYLYTLECELKQEETVVDTYSALVGLRQIQWDSEQGMVLNGKGYSVKGICCHQDHGGVGAAVTKEVMEYRIDCLKRLGINAYRCAHHAPSKELLEICDRKGMLVMVENRHFSVSEEVLKQLDALIILSRNHPCVFLYSLFNEEPWQKEERGRRIAEKMRKRVLALDCTRAVTGAQNGGLLEQSNASDVLDLIGINYCMKEYDAAHERMPRKVILGTENCPTYATRGVYRSNEEQQVFASYGDEWADFSESLEETMKMVEERKFVAGCFVWCGFDHRGEPTPYGYPSVLSHWGISDVCGFPKSTAYLLAAWYRKDLFAHLLPHWNWKEGELVRVCVFTNGDDAELFLNGRSLGTKEVIQKRAEWEVLFEPGKLSVVVKRGEERVSNRL
ncbi:MAG: glycoside hydrolase family 2 protein [Ruminococcaceae bacterium]|nr:glycoside hydrolase family 2 protein [Oscillospiraceae bacterium]